MGDIFMYVTKEEYYRICEELGDGETINIYIGNNVEIDLKKIGTKIYKFIANYGEDNIDKCLEEMYLKRNKIII